MAVNNKNFFSQKSDTFRDIVYENISHWYILIATLVIAIFVSTIYTLAFVTPMYRSTAKLYIINKESSDFTTTDFYVSSYLAQDIPEIIMDSKILGQVSTELGNKYSAGRLKKIVSVNKRENTRIIEISAITTDAAESKKIVDSVCKVSGEKLAEILGVDQIKIIREGDLPSSPYSPNLTKNIFLAMIFAFAVVEIIIIANYIFNYKISTPEDVEKYLDLSILASIPYNKPKSKTKSEL